MRPTAVRGCIHSNIYIHAKKERAFSRAEKGRTWILQTDVSLIDYMRNELTEPRWLDALA